MPLRAERGFLADFGEIPASALARARVMVLNYPNNPTGAIASLDYFLQAVDFARRHDILLMHDAAYTHVSFEGYRPPSLLEVEGAKDVTVEFHTLSKTYNMAGWRLGMAAGNAKAIEALYVLKSQIDTSHFQAAQEAGVAALTGDQTWLVERNEIYRERRDIAVAAVRRAGLTAEVPQAGLYIWAKLRPGQASADYCDQLLDQGGVSVTPGSAFGVHGEGYIRLSLGTATARLREAMQRLEAWAVRVQEAARPGVPSSR
jgi:LL-diaminopimelate aminotransferase